jgi:hypothetical protein
VAAEASATPDMDQQQEAVSKHPAALPTVQIDRGSKNAA